MKEQDFNFTIQINSSAKEVYDKIRHVENWWISNVEGKSAAIGDVFTVSLGTTYKTFRVTGLIPARKMVWDVIDCHLPWNTDVEEWKNTRLVWEIKPTGDEVQVTFTHAGLIPALECYNQCAKSWSSYIKESLVKYITEGYGLPNHF